MIYVGIMIYTINFIAAQAARRNSRMRRCWFWSIVAIIVTGLEITFAILIAYRNWYTSLSMFFLLFFILFLYFYFFWQKFYTAYQCEGWPGSY